MRKDYVPPNFCRFFIWWSNEDESERGHIDGVQFPDGTLVINHPHYKSLPFESYEEIASYFWKHEGKIASIYMLYDQSPLTTGGYVRRSTKKS